MNLRQLFLVASLVATPVVWGQQRVERHIALINARNLVVTTSQGTEYYYLVSANHTPVIDFTGAQVRIVDDEFSLGNIRSMRLRTLPHFVLDEDSTTFDRTKTVDHGLLALRRSMGVGRWNSLVLPVDLTSEQLIDAFGEGTELASPRGVREGDVAVVEFQTIALEPKQTVVRAGYHYLVRPTREADISGDSWTSSFISGQRLSGPLYVIPNVSTSNVKTPRVQSFSTEDDAVEVYFRGTFLKLDDSVLNGTRIVNKRIDAGTYMLSGDARMVKNQDAAEVKAFTSWVQDMSDQRQDQLRFYVDGVNEDISEFADIDAIAQPAASALDDDAVYDLGGRRVGTTRERTQLKPGIYVVGGKKIVVK